MPRHRGVLRWGILNHVDGEPGHSGVTIENGSIQEFSIGALVVRGNNNRLRNLATSSNTSVGLVVAESEHGEIERNSSASECIGIQVAGAREVRVERNSVSDHTCAGIALYGSDHVRVADNAVSQTREGNDTSGVFVIDHSDHNRIERNSVSGNGFVGVIVEQSHDNEVAGNDIFRNSTGIILFASRNAITGNQVADSVSCPDGCGVGISLEGGEGNLIARNEVRRTPHEGILIAAFDPDTPTVDNVVRDNRIRDATVDGFGVATQGEGTVSGTLIQGNLAVGSGDDGFDIESSATTLTKNTANENHDLGIEAVPGVTDGGGNKASGNGNPLQCTNVFCK